MKREKRTSRLLHVLRDLDSYYRSLAQDYVPQDSNGILYDKYIAEKY